MESTLGKRIMSKRKQLGMTQDQLAEKVGVTAQAVSKWENDQSCPDITMLPKLAELFGTTTDELLGRPRPEPVHMAEVEDQGMFEIRWDAGRKTALALGVLILLVGGLALVNAVCSRGASLWEIIWPSALLVFGVRLLFSRASFLGIGSVLTGSYFLLVHMGVLPFEMGGELICPVILMIIGISLMVDVLRKPKTIRFRMPDGKNGASGNHYMVDGERFTYSASFGEQNQPVTMDRLSHGEVSTNFGDYSLDLSGVTEIAEGCLVEVKCCFGELTLLIPQRFRVKCDSSTSFAAIETIGEPDADPVGTILLRASASFGQMRIRYI